MSFPEVVFDFNKGQYQPCDQHAGVLFHHIPKTAGSTFRAILESFFLAEEVCPAEVPEELSQYATKPSVNFKLFAGHFSYEVNEELLAEKVWITFLRNPVDRIISYYNNLIIPERMPDSWVKRFADRPDWQEFLQEIRKMSLHEFIASSNEKAAKITANRQTQAFLPDSIRLSVKDWSTHNQEYVELAKRNLKERFAFVGIQEHFDLSLDLFSMTFALNPINADPYTTNLNTKKSTKDRYKVEPDILALIKEKNSMDIELYEYATQLFFQRMHMINNKAVVNNHMHLMSSVHNELANINTRSLKQSIDDVFSIQGFYPLPRKVTKLAKIGLFPKHRWTRESPAAIQFLFNFQNNKTYLLNIEVPRCIDNSVINTISLQLDQKRLSHQVKKKLVKSGYTLQFTIDGHEFSQTNTLHRIEIYSDLRFESKNPKARKLSVAVSKIEIREKS